MDARWETSPARQRTRRTKVKVSLSSSLSALPLYLRVAVLTEEPKEVHDGSFFLVVGRWR